MHKALTLSPALLPPLLLPLPFSRFPSPHLLALMKYHKRQKRNFPFVRAVLIELEATVTAGLPASESDHDSCQTRTRITLRLGHGAPRRRVQVTVTDSDSPEA